MPVRGGESFIQPTFYRDFTQEFSLSGTGIGPDISFTRTGTATRFNQNGLLETVAANVPRFDYDPVTLQPRGLLIEEGRTNLALQSLSVDSNNGWGKGVNTTRIGQETQLGHSATIYEGNGSQANINVTQAFSVTSGVTYTASIYARLVAGSKPTAGNLIVCETDPTNAATRVNLSYNSSNLDSTMRRYSASFTAIGTGTIRVYFAADQNNTAQISLLAAQVELGAFATSYISTTNAAVTRGNDVAAVTPISSFVTSTGEESLFVEFSAYTFGATGGFPRIVQFDQGATGQANRYAPHLVQSSSTIFITYAVNNVGQFGGNSSPYSLNSIAKSANGIAFNNARHAVNGSLIGSDNTSVNLRTTQNTHLHIGNAQGTGAFLNGHIRKVGYWPVRLSNFQLQQLTK